MESEEIAKTKQKGEPMADNSDGTSTRTAPPTKPTDVTDGDSSEMPAMPTDTGGAPEMNCEENEQMFLFGVIIAQKLEQEMKIQNKKERTNPQRKSVPRRSAFAMQKHNKNIMCHFLALSGQPK